MNVEVTVKPGSKKGPLVEKSGDGLTVYLREKPHDGEANAALIKMLAEYFDVAKTSIVIKSGSKSHKKLIQIG
ncbi:DUF167 domain-containing protein [Candidatus Saccharibacteria bacterium]|nr:DUF167 domain-containing protein [Candidatus Saccharibacteria bacterium]